MTIVHYSSFKVRKKNYVIRDIDPSSDAVHYYGYINSNVSLLNIKPYDSLESARRDLKLWSSFTSDDGEMFAIAELGCNELIGILGFNTIEKIRLCNSQTYMAEEVIVELVCDLHPNYFGCGVMALALEWLLEYIPKTTTIKATILKKNVPALNLAKKLNFAILGVEKQNNQDCYILEYDRCI